VHDRSSILFLWNHGNRSASRFRPISGSATSTFRRGTFRRSQAWRAPTSSTSLMEPPPVPTTNYAAGSASTSSPSNTSAPSRRSRRIEDGHRVAEGRSKDLRASVLARLQPHPGAPRRNGAGPSSRAMRRHRYAAHPGRGRSRSATPTRSSEMTMKVYGGMSARRSNDGSRRAPTTT
jgi:hypothetical protein